MGIECPCGVIVNAVSENNNVRFTGQMGTVRGDLIYVGSICVTTLAASSLSLQFIDRETMGGVNNFTFVANSFTSVVCNRLGQSQICEVTVTGTGLVNGVEFPFVAVFRDQPGPGGVDMVQSFVITGFFTQNGSAPVEQGSIIALGCEDN